MDCVRATSVLVTNVPMFVPMMIGIAWSTFKTGTQGKHRGVSGQLDTSSAREASTEAHPHQQIRMIAVKIETISGLML